MCQYCDSAPNMTENVSELAECIKQGDVSNAIPHLDEEEMIDLSLRVVDKLKAMSDEEFAKFKIEAAE